MKTSHIQVWVLEWSHGFRLISTYLPAVLWLFSPSVRAKTISTLLSTSSPHFWLSPWPPTNLVIVILLSQASQDSVPAIIIIPPNILILHIQSVANPCVLWSIRGSIYTKEGPPSPIISLITDMTNWIMGHLPDLPPLKGTQTKFYNPSYQILQGAPDMDLSWMWGKTLWFSQDNRAPLPDNSDTSTPPVHFSNGLWTTLSSSVTPHYLSIGKLALLAVPDGLQSGLKAPFQVQLLQLILQHQKFFFFLTSITL